MHPCLESQATEMVSSTIKLVLECIQGECEYLVSKNGYLETLITVVCCYLIIIMSAEHLAFLQHSRWCIEMFLPTDEDKLLYELSQTLRDPLVEVIFLNFFILMEMGKNNRF